VISASGLTWFSVENTSAMVRIDIHCDSPAGKTCQNQIRGHVVATTGMLLWCQMKFPVQDLPAWRCRSPGQCDVRYIPAGHTLAGCHEFPACRKFGLDDFSLTGDAAKG
jgi:hypothetical protein